MHIVQIIANSSSVPYFTWFAEENTKKKEVKMTFIVLYHSEPSMIKEMNQLGYQCYWIKFDHKKRKYGWIYSTIKLIKLFRKLKPDIIHSHLFDDSFPSVIAAKIAGIKHRLITKQDTTFHWFYAPKAVILDKIINLLATKLIAVSQECKEFIINKEKAKEEKVILIHHGIPLDKLTFSSEKHKQELIEKFKLKNKIVIGTVARLIEWKGHMILIEVLEELIKRRPDIVFIFAGVGELENSIIKIIKEKKLENNVILAGWIEREKIPSLYSIMDIYIHAAKYEPFGFVIAEAMLNGIPVLSTKTGAALDAIKTKENGYLVDYDNVEQFIEGVEFLLNNDKKTIGLKGKATATEMYSFELMWKSHITLYNLLMHGTKI